MSWLTCLILAAFSWAAHVACLKVLGDKLPAPLVTFSFYVVALLTTAIIFVSQKTSTPPAVFANKTILFAIIGAGVTIALADYFFVQGVSLGAPISLYSPLFCTLGLALISIIGLLFFSETLTLSKLLGFAFAATGFFLMVR